MFRPTPHLQHPQGSRADFDKKPDLRMFAMTSSNNVIGKNGKNPFHDFSNKAYLRELIKGYTVVVGRKTYESLGCGNELFNRSRVVVLTNHKDLVLATKHRGIYSRHDDHVMMMAKKEKTFILGGKQLFEDFFQSVSYITVMRFNIEIEEGLGTTLFPQIKPEEWTAAHIARYSSMKGEPSSSIIQYNRRPRP